MIDIFVRGGWALWIIGTCSVIAMGVTLERWRTLRKASVDSEALLGKLFALIEQGSLQEAIDLCTATGGPIADTLGIGLRKLVFLERIGKKPEEIEEGIVAAMEDHGGYVVEFLERNLTTLATVASLAPILGMLGTVTGMIRAFLDMKTAGSLTASAVAGGIGEALYCTAGGLIVAALATVEFNYFTTRVNRFVLRVQAAGTALVERILYAQASAAIRPQPEARATVDANGGARSATPATAAQPS
jgi:biopolymer transport protein ExbB